MGKELAPWSLLLCLILLSKLAHGNGDQEMNEFKHPEELMGRDGDHKILRLPSMGGGDDNKNGPGMHGEHVDAHAHPSSRMHHLDLTSAIFFRMDDLKQGRRLALSFPKVDPLTSPPLLPREQAESIPLSSKALPSLLKAFSAREGSRLARAIKEGIKKCEDAAIPGENKFCATSLESMIDFAHSILGSRIRVVKTQQAKSLETILQNYTIQEIPKEVPTPIKVACHPMVYPYTIYYCHSQEDTMVFKVSLVGDNGEKVEAAAACHIDTSHWDTHHVAFGLLGVAPGTSVCHTFPEDNLLWVPVVN